MTDRRTFLKALLAGTAAAALGAVPVLGRAAPGRESLRSKAGRLTIRASRAARVIVYGLNQHGEHVRELVVIPESGTATTEGKWFGERPFMIDAEADSPAQITCESSGKPILRFFTYGRTSWSM